MFVCLRPPAGPDTHAHACALNVAQTDPKTVTATHQVVLLALSIPTSACALTRKAGCLLIEYKSGADYPSAAPPHGSTTWNPQNEHKLVIRRRIPLSLVFSHAMDYDHRFDWDATEVVAMAKTKQARCFVGRDREYDDSVGLTDLLKEHACSVSPWSSD
ncbi:unnamed protein product [Schistocephalus solidus]|uniref:Inositol-pentakisphosphate 2-kinase n=1 Tax=Schistocephalus solidus TaxID=70667 RepID=A0A183TJ43_SCHSO|nr:unnamed protein product [Schistocephalus solidus]